MTTFGKTDNGSTSFTSSTDKIAVSAATPAGSGTVQSAGAQIWMDSTGSTNSKFVIYADSGGAPGALLAESDVVNFNITTANSERIFSFSGANQISITGGTQYWIGVAWQDPGTPSVRVSRDNTNTTDGRHEQSGAGFTWPTLPSPYGTPTLTSGGPISAYVTYTETAGGGGGGIVPVIRSSSTDTDPNLTKTLAPAKPAGLAVGDLMIAVHTSDADSSLAGMTAPAGWAQVGAQAGNAADNYSFLKIWSKVAVQADVDATSFSFSDPNTSESSVVLFAVQVGTYDSTTPTTTPAFTTQPRPSPEAVQDATAPSVTGVVDGLLICGMTADTNGTQQTFPSPPTGMTVINQASTPWTLDGVFKQALSSTSATGTRSAGTSPTSGANGYNSGSFVINPAPAPPSDVARLSGGFLSLL